ncbi:MAG: DUF2513 domain-containing protein [Oscillospiraceae bacterium]|nr:DUF2513 domain-containing protein [Oscillospiraceae bacterium]
MKLNPDCIRDILLSIEEITDIQTPFYFSSETAVTKKDTPSEHIAKYGKRELEYHLVQCNENGLLGEMKKNVLGTYTVKSLSPKGHDFLQSIRDNSAWGKIKEFLISSGKSSLAALFQIALDFSTEKVKQLTGL